MTTDLTNLALLTDSYKPTQFPMYPPDMTGLFSFFESRGGTSPTTSFVGLQYFLARYLLKGLTSADVNEARAVLHAHFGMDLFNYDGMMKTVTRHEGRIPVIIKAVPEGTTVPCHNVLMTVESMDPELPFWTNYIETLLVETWYPTSVATRSRAMRQRILRSLEKTGTPDLIDFKLHDFGFRGSTCPEAAALGGFAHLTNFKGTDTLPALMLARQYYSSDMAGFSVPASEHSVMTAWGKDHELDACRHILDAYPKGFVSVVSDTYDIFNAAERIWGGDLRAAVMGRDGTLVVRPDSGDPVSVLAHVMRILAYKFGFVRNDKGYKVLPKEVRVIQGDGIDQQSLDDILRYFENNGWSADNITFGSGGGLLQKDLTRDTHKFAFKASAARRGDVWSGIMKDPVTDHGKRSKAGRLALVKNADGAFDTVPLEAVGDRANALVTVYDGDLMKLAAPTTLEDIRQRMLV